MAWDFERFFALSTIVSFLIFLNIAFSGRFYQFRARPLIILALLFNLLMDVQPGYKYLYEPFPFSRHFNNLGRIVAGERPLIISPKP